MRHTTLLLVSARLGSLRASACGSAFALDVGKVQASSFSKAVVNESSVCWASLSAEPASSDSVPVHT